MQLPDHLLHQKLIKVSIEQCPHDRVDAEGVVVDTRGDIRDHAGTNIRARRDERQGRRPAIERPEDRSNRVGKPNGKDPAARRPVRHLPRRPDPPERRLRRGQAAGGRRLQGRRAVADLLRPAGLQFRRPRRRPGDRPPRRSTRSPTATTSSRRAAPAPACSPSTIPELFADEPDMAIKAAAFAAKCCELVSFLVDKLGVTAVAASYAGVAAYHDSCSGLRELGVRDQPRKLLASVEGLRLVELDEADVCCGFGGTFAVKYGELSDAIVARKSDKIAATGADTLLAGDLGCLMNMAGKLQRQGQAGEGAPCRRGAGRDDRRAGDRRAGRERRRNDRRRHDAALQGQRPRRAARPAPAGRAAARQQLHRPARRRRRRGCPSSTRCATARATIKDHTLAHLDLYLEAYEQQGRRGRRPRALRARFGGGDRRSSSTSARRAAPRW